MRRQNSGEGQGEAGASRMSRQRIEIGSKYIHAEQSELEYGKPVYDVIGSRGVIAQVGWYPQWKRYVMFAYENTVWDVGCLDSICKFIKTLETK